VPDIIDKPIRASELPPGLPGDLDPSSLVLLCVRQVIPARLLNDSSAAGQIVMPTEVGIHDFADASRKVVDGGPSPAMTVWSGPMGDSFRRLV
jgi:hypothetical protein